MPNQLKLNNLSKTELINLMIQKEVFTLESVGELFGITKEAVRVSLKRRDIKFRKLKEKAVIEWSKDFYDRQKWYPITNPETNGKYYVTHDGQVSREYTKTIKGVKVPYKKPVGFPVTQKGKEYTQVFLYLGEGKTKRTTASKLKSDNVPKQQDRCV